jgi:hypothetical protein
MRGFGLASVGNIPFRPARGGGGQVRHQLVCWIRACTGRKWGDKRSPVVPGGLRFTRHDAADATSVRELRPCAYHTAAIRPHQRCTTHATPHHHRGHTRPPTCPLRVGCACRATRARGDPPPPASSTPLHRYPHSPLRCHQHAPPLPPTSPTRNTTMIMRAGNHRPPPTYQPSTTNHHPPSTIHHPPSANCQPPNTKR